MIAGPIALLTDFGYRDHYPGVLRGVIASIAPAASVIDITHGVASQDVTAGALLLSESWRFFPPRTIFVAVVDPGVGTTRRAIAVRAATGGYFIGPDNGLLSLAVEQAGLDSAVELQSPRYRLADASSTFHGRDIFAPAAAHLWNGVEISRLGEAVDDLAQLDLPRPIVRGNQLIGAVIYADGYGNLITNLTRAAVDTFYARLVGHRLLVALANGPPISLYNTYADAPRGEMLALFGSFERLEIAIRDGNAAVTCGAGVGTEVILQAQL